MEKKQAHWLKDEEVKEASPEKIASNSAICKGKDGKFYFTDEVLACFCGPFDSQKEAVEALGRYALKLDFYL